MILVVDANILFAALIKKGMTSAILLEDIDLYTPQFVFEEFAKYRDEILAKTKRTRDNFDKFMGFLKRKILTIPKEYFSDFTTEARLISPDHDDVAYFALALNLGGGIWSNDKKLKDLQKSVIVYNTKDLIELFYKS